MVVSDPQPQAEDHRGLDSTRGARVSTDAFECGRRGAPLSHATAKHGQTNGDTSAKRCHGLSVERIGRRSSILRKRRRR